MRLIKPCSWSLFPSRIEITVGLKYLSDAERRGRRSLRPPQKEVPRGCPSGRNLRTLYAFREAEARSPCVPRQEAAQVTRRPRVSTHSGLCSRLFLWLLWYLWLDVEVEEWTAESATYPYFLGRRWSSYNGITNFILWNRLFRYLGVCICMAVCQSYM